MVSGYFGLPGCGKTTFLTMIAQKELRKIRAGKSAYDKVFCNFYCEGCYKLDFHQLGSFLIENALILIDEITLFADSRDFKTFDKKIKQFFLLHRHYGCDIIYFTQHYNNVDKKIRDITFNLYFVTTGRIFPISKARQIFRTLDINEQTHEIVHGYRFANIWDILFGKVTRRCWRPRWYKYFDSYECDRSLPELPLTEWSSSEEDTTVSV